MCIRRKVRWAVLDRKTAPQRSQGSDLSYKYNELFGRIHHMLHERQSQSGSSHDERLDIGTTANQAKLVVVLGNPKPKTVGQFPRGLIGNVLSKCRASDIDQIWLSFAQQSAQPRRVSRSDGHFDMVDELIDVAR
jgi:hypothetical protein